MSDRSVDTDEFLELAAGSFAHFLEDLDAAGIATDPALRLETSHGMVSYYDRSRVLISVAVPGGSGPGAALQTLAVRSLLGLTDDGMLEAIFRFAIPFAVAHELGHHLRHVHGRFGDELWHEEQVANMFASALQKRRYSPAERAEGVRLIEAVLGALGPAVGSRDTLVDSYGSLPAALDVAGLINEATLSGIALMQKYAPGTPAGGAETLLPVELLGRLEHRDSLVEEFGQTYTSDVLRYVYHQLGWLLIAMSSRESFFLDVLAREHLIAGRPLLPAPTSAAADEEQVHALAAAAGLARGRSAVGASYFELRYRDAFLALLLRSPSAELRRAGEAARNIASTEGSLSGAGGTLDLMAPLLPPQLRRLLPAALAACPSPEAAELAVRLPLATDRRLFDHAVLGLADEAAAAALERLGLLWAMDLFDRLSPEVVLPLSQSIAVVAVRAGQTVVWEGDNDLDIYCVERGQMEVVDGGGRRLALLGEGEMFGEVQYLLRRGRSKTVRAVVASVLVAVPERELSFLVHRHPETALQIARTLARRLT
ncbi:MAG TPA: cyclic nucleotide-binding domain-containing protein [Acidimicrobiales bacterium]|nr:cyclic nucleotide-binding domain-containing protein [Acidimicrobiales bacterium]